MKLSTSAATIFTLIFASTTLAAPAAEVSLVPDGRKGYQGVPAPTMVKIREAAAEPSVTPDNRKGYQGVPAPTMIKVREAAAEPSLTPDGRKGYNAVPVSIS